jgi:hypothetical protein
MTVTHAGLEITNAECAYVVDDLVTTRDQYKIPEREKHEWFALLAPIGVNIVQAS